MQFYLYFCVQFGSFKIFKLNTCNIFYLCHPICSLLLFASHRGSKTAVAWWSTLVKDKVVTADSAMCSVYDLLSNTCGVKRSNGLFAQTIAHLAGRVEKAVFSALQSVPSGNFYSIKAKLMDLMDFIKIARQCDHELLRYTMNVKEASKQEHVFHFATDKANVGKLGLINTLLSFGNGYAAIMTPQAAWNQKPSQPPPPPPPPPTEKAETILHFPCVLVYSFCGGLLLQTIHR